VPLLPVVSVVLGVVAATALMSALGPDIGILAFLLLAGVVIGLCHALDWLIGGPEPWDFERQALHSPRTKSDNLPSP